MKKLQNQIITVRAITFLALSLFYAMPGRSMESHSGYVGQSFDLYCPSITGGTVYAAQWYCTDGALAVLNTDNNNCRVTIEKYFTSTLYVTCDYYYLLGSGVNQQTRSGSMTVAFKCNPVTLSLSETNVTLNPGDSIRLSYSLIPTITPTPRVGFSSNSTAVTVNSEGYVYAVEPGEADITATNSAGPNATCHVKVSNTTIPIQNVTIPSSIDIKVNQEQKLEFTVHPSNATVTGYRWYVKTGDEHISLSEDGTLRGLNPGTATICCMVNEKLNSNETVVHVSELDPGIMMGDVNGDTKINGSDIVELVDHIMGRTSNKFVEAAADLSGDGKINGSDLTLEIELVMSQGMSSAPMLRFYK